MALSKMVRTAYGVVSRMIDDVDRKILRILQENARTSNAEIARRVEMAPSAVLERIRKLEARGVLKGYEARLDPASLDRGLLAFVFVRANEAYGSWRVGEALARLPEVQEVHHVAGEDCYVVKVRAADAEALGRLCRERIAAVGDIQSTRTTIALGTIKETLRLPLPGDCDAPVERRAAPPAKEGAR